LLPGLPDIKGFLSRDSAAEFTAATRFSQSAGTKNMETFLKRVKSMERDEIASSPPFQRTLSLMNALGSDHVTSAGASGRAAALAFRVRHPRGRGEERTADEEGGEPFFSLS